MKESKKSYIIRSVPGNPDWKSIPQLEVSRVLWKPDCGIRAFGRICHDSQFLYVSLRAAEKQIRAEYTAPLSPVHEDSCLEFFFMPEGEGRYFNFEINPNGCLHVGFGHGREDSTVLFRKDMHSLFEIRTDKNPDGWEAGYRIPLSFLRLFLPDFSFTGTLLANVYKCGDRTKQEHYLSWNPVLSGTPDFHRPEDFGIMIFE